MKNARAVRSVFWFRFRALGKEMERNKPPLIRGQRILVGKIKNMGLTKFGVLMVESAVGTV